MLEDVYYCHQFLYPWPFRCKKSGGIWPPSSYGCAAPGMAYTLPLFKPVNIFCLISKMADN